MFGVGGHGSSSWEKWEQFGDVAFSFATKAVLCLPLRRRGRLTIFIQWLQETFLQQLTWILLMKEKCPGHLSDIPGDVVDPSKAKETKQARLEKFSCLLFRVFMCDH